MDCSMKYHNICWICMLHLHSIQTLQHLQRNNCMHIYIPLLKCVSTPPFKHSDRKLGKTNLTIAFQVLTWQQLWLFLCYLTFSALRFNLAQMQAFLIIGLNWKKLPHFKITSWCRQCDDNFRFQGQLTSLLPGFHCALVIAELLGDECNPPFSIPQTHNGLGRTFTCKTQRFWDAVVLSIAILSTLT